MIHLTWLFWLKYALNFWPVIRITWSNLITINYSIACQPTKDVKIIQILKFWQFKISYTKCYTFGRWGLEYADCIPCLGLRPLPKTVALSMTLDCVWWWESDSGHPGNEKYSFIVITPRSTLAQSSITCWGPIIASNRFV